MTSPELADPVAAFVAGADLLLATARRVPDDAWERPGLGEWSVRSLVGHAGRSLTTVVDYAATAALEVDVGSAAAYYRAIATVAHSAAATERGVEAGVALGADPVRTLEEYARRAATLVTELDGDRIVHTPAGGMRLSRYLPTRTFELAVHSLDLGAAIGVEITLPEPVADTATNLAVRVAALGGHTNSLLRALTGRAPLPAGFSVV
ncbi:maleylpyruvate isomerase N-terminal domain-containing protein [Rhodococcus sp. HNM0569]|uniref:maleylpyruvate isomerase N-terminal domain-containing protein n=1 Tax=Rhodococcus sp. HNM0569 TaxID=2716340 RepID=UPI00146AA11C|nr:maleylpyruvate isomerase N-terminal domain-containing protein [Rhodococcus sp. HNM0569]NLU81274.1 mycothiol maleylpyruvate isomerase [Rhodococcus sp. HNM0569]